MLNVKRDNYEMVHFQGVWILRCRIKIEGEEKPSNEIQDQSLWTSTLFFFVFVLFLLFIFTVVKNIALSWAEPGKKKRTRIAAETFDLKLFLLFLFSCFCLCLPKRHNGIHPWIFGCFSFYVFIPMFPLHGRREAQV